MFLAQFKKKKKLKKNNANLVIFYVVHTINDIFVF